MISFFGLIKPFSTALELTLEILFVIAFAETLLCTTQFLIKIFLNGV